ncbi:MAG: cyanophycinase [Thermomonas sp.]|nr:cyanophycinase [Thermomonas sp.]
MIRHSSVPKFLAAALGLLLAAGAMAADAGHYVIGERVAAKTPGKVQPGLLLMGGGDRNFDAMHWFMKKAGNGHIVVLRASQAGEIGEEFFNEVGGIKSVETFVFNDRDASTDPKILAALKRADGIFLAGGDQSRYVRFWRGTPIADALDAHVRAGKPLAGTSAGLAMQGEYLYGAMDGGSQVSPAALADPLGDGNTIETGFLHIAQLKGVITDTHFSERARLGRLIAFVAKGERLAGKPLIGLGVDEDAAVAVEGDGRARLRHRARRRRDRGQGRLRAEAGRGHRDEPGPGSIRWSPAWSRCCTCPRAASRNRWRSATLPCGMACWWRWMRLCW